MILLRNPLRPRHAGALAVAFALAAAAPGAAQEKPTLTADDYGQWERLGNAVLSHDGAWLATSIGRVNEEDELRIQPTANPDSVVVVEYGLAPEFSANGRWLAYSIWMSEDERERLEKAKKPAHNALGIMDLRSGDVVEIDDIASSSFSSDGAYLAMRRYAPQGNRDWRGIDLVVREVETGTDLVFGNVAEYAWRDLEDGAPLLAMLIDAEEGAGNAVQLYDPATGRLRVLDGTDARYSGLSWRDDASDLAVFRTAEPSEEEAERWADTASVVLAFRNVGQGAGAMSVLDPSNRAGFPDGYRVVTWEDLDWSDDGERLFFGIQARTEASACDADEPDAEGEEGEEGDAGAESEPEDAASDEDGDAACEEDDDEDPPTVEIWHAGDVDIVPTQKVRADRDRRDNHLSVWHLGPDTFVRLEDDDLDTVRPIEGAAHAVGIDGTPYDADRMFGPAFSDIWLVDVATGERRPALRRIQYFMGASPSGRYLLWLEDDHYWTYDTETGQSACLTAELATSFVDLEDDHTVDQKPPFGVAGWLEGDAAVLLNDKHDIWRVMPDGSGGERITWGADANVRHRWARVDRDFDDPAIDPDAPMYFSVYDDWAEEWGYARADRVGARPETLVWGPARYTSLQKAEDAEAYLYRVESFEDSPDWFVARGAALASAVQVTRTNPFQDDYAWGRAELIEFDNAWGDHLQGSLYYPANYEPGRQYPMIVYIYEIRSNAVRSYNVPSERSYYDFQGWIQNGYFVWQPDIVYRDRDPGLSAMATLEPSVAAVVETGMVDPDRVGLIGHSWGGYQTTFAVTQTDIFAAAVAGAPLTNLFSMYLSVYWNSGGTDARIFEISQGRMEVPFWEDEDAYRRNSPVFHIENMTTPLLMAQGTEDGAVDFNQGVEFYNAARRAGKDFVFLVYNDENHGFRQEANQRDYHRRIMEWFGHYLKGEPAPDWLTEGVPYLEQPGGRKTAGR